MLHRAWARVPRTARRLPLVATGFAALVWGMWLGLLRVGWALPLPYPDQLIAHGPLMVCGFLGTLISLERAVGLGFGPAFAGPIITAAGALLLVAVPPGPVAPALITLGSLIVVAMYAAIWRRQPSLFIATMGVGAVAWAAGNLQWMAGAAIARVVYWWLAFLVLTIAGERLELNRVLRPTRAVQRAFVLAIAVVAVGVLMFTWWPGAGVRTMGVGLVALTAWLARYDIARRTVRQQGLTRFMAVGLLAGYAWLGVGGILAAATGITATGVVYDALLHAVFLGFVMSMVFAHAPIILSAVLGVRLDYRPVFYLHLGVLHASVLLRIIGDLVEDLGRWRAWGALLNVVALLLFMATTARAVLASQSPHRPIG